MKTHATEVVKCNAVSCKSNDNRRCKRSEISVDEKGQCRQYEGKDNSPFDYYRASKEIYGKRY